MMLRALDRVRMFSRRLRARRGSSAVILLYHRIADEPDDSYGLCTTPEAFHEHLEVIRAVAHPASLSEVVAGLEGGRIADRSVCVTFDDGYVDNLGVAGPMLENAGVPATVFVTTGRGGREHELWWDELEAVFQTEAALPHPLEIEIGGASHRWDPGPSEGGGNGPGTRRLGKVFSEAVPANPRLRMFREVYHLVKPLDYTEQRRVIGEVRAWAGLEGKVRPTRRLLDADGVAALDRHPAIDVGAHTENHPLLTAHPLDVQRREIERGRRTLEAWLGRPVRSFAYPYGGFTEDTVETTRDLGFDHACSCLWGPLTKGTDPFLLPRLELSSVDGERLADRLVHFFGPP